MGELEENEEKKALCHSEIEVDFDSVLEVIGNCGKAQWTLIVFVQYICITTGMNAIGIIFLGAVPSFRCFIPGIDGEAAYENVTETEILNYNVPMKPNWGYDACARYNYTYENCSLGTFDCIDSSEKPGTVSCSAGYHFDTSVYETTIATEWNLVCDRMIYGTVSVSILYLGSFLGSVVGGNFADLYGRSPAMLIGQLGVLATGIGSSFCTNLIIYTLIRFLQFVFNSFSFVAAFCYSVEISSGEWRTNFSITYQVFYAFGYMSLSGLAYNWRKWRDLQLATTLPSIIFLFLWVFIPESPSWLLAKKKVLKAKKVCEYIAQRNGRECPEDIWESGSKFLEESCNKETKYSSLELFRWPGMRIVTLNVMFIWISISLVYFGLSLNIVNLAGNAYINNVIGGAMDLASLAIVIFALDRYGRKPTLTIFLISSGIFCLSSTISNNYADDNADLLRLGNAFAMLGKLAASGAFATVYTSTAELYPTVLRSTGIGIASMSAYLGNIIAPYAIQLEFSVPWLTGTVFGVLSILAGFSSSVFPETRGMKMLTTIEDAEEFYRSSKFVEVMVTMLIFIKSKSNLLGNLRGNIYKYAIDSSACFSVNLDNILQRC